jgi:hypothetical protein
MTYAEALERYGLPEKQVKQDAWDGAQARYPSGGRPSSTGRFSGTLRDRRGGSALNSGCGGVILLV